MGLTIEELRKTTEGRQLAENHVRFITDQKMYQGYERGFIHVEDDQVTDDEIAEMKDLDGTRNAVIARRNASQTALRIAKEEELAKRRAKVLAQRRDELELRKLEREMGLEPMRAVTPVTECLPQDPPPAADEPKEKPKKTRFKGPTDRELEDKLEEQMNVFYCSKCQLQFDSKRGLEMHRRRAKVHADDKE